MFVSDLRETVLSIFHGRESREFRYSLGHLKSEKSKKLFLSVGKIFAWWGNFDFVLVQPEMEKQRSPLV